MLDDNQPNLDSDPPFYFPLEHGRYDVKPGLFKFPHDFGHAKLDSKVFQFDREFSRYRKEKMAARQERLGKYYTSRHFDPGASHLINRFIIRRLLAEYPDMFVLSRHKQQILLDCRLTRETLRFSPDYQLLQNNSHTDYYPPYRDGFDALACQIQEDLSVIRLTTTGEDQIIALHLCLPNHWSAEGKIGKGFIAVHEPVPHMEKINQSASQLIQTIINKGPFVRFAWGIATDDRLNHHPVPAAMQDPGLWQGRSFDPIKANLYLRVERQTLHGFAGGELGLFTIRTYIYDINWIQQYHTEKIPLLRSAIKTMSAESLSYKGLSSDAPAILSWLKNNLGH